MQPIKIIEKHISKLRVLFILVLILIAIPLYYFNLNSNLKNIFGFSFFNPIAQALFLPSLISLAIIGSQLCLALLILLQEVWHQKIEGFVMVILCAIQMVLCLVYDYALTVGISQMVSSKMTFIQYLSQMIKDVIEFNPWTYLTFAYFIMSTLLLGLYSHQFKKLQ